MKKEIVRDCPSADLIRSLCEKYPGRYLVIDFWGMYCGPCRAEIEYSKEQRAKIAQRDDVKLVFIAEERTSEGSDEYKKFYGAKEVKENATPVRGMGVPCNGNS